MLSQNTGTYGIINFHRPSHVLYDLATYPEYAEPLREVAAPVECDDWTKAAIEKMDKIHDFFKESMRFNTI